MISPRRRGEYFRIIVINPFFNTLVFQGRDAGCPPGHEEEVNLSFVSLLQFNKGLKRN